MYLARPLKGLLFAGVAVVATASLAFPTVRDDDGEHGEESEMHEQMEVIEDQVRLLRRSLRKPEQNAASLASLHTAQQAAMVCKALAPHRTESESDKEAFVAAYRADMCTMIQQLLECEKAVLAGDNEKAQALFKDAKRSEKAGHEKYQEKEEDDG